MIGGFRLHAVSNYSGSRVPAAHAPEPKKKKNHVQVRDFALKGCTATVYVCGAVLKRLKAQLRFWKQLFLELW